MSAFRWFDAQGEPGRVLVRSDGEAEQSPERVAGLPQRVHGVGGLRGVEQGVVGEGGCG